MFRETFSTEDIAHLQERQDAVSQLEGVGNFWVSPDVAIAKPKTVEPGQMVPGINLILSKKYLPPGMDITRGALDSLDVSVRSFFAQTGIEVKFHSSSLSDAQIKNLQEGQGALIPVDIINHGQRSVEIEGKIMRLFWANDRNRLRGADLLSAIRSGDFTVDGVEGEEWFLGGWGEDDKFATDGRDSDKGLCVVVRLKPQRFYIPYSPVPIKKDEKRKRIDQLADLLVPIPKDKKFVFEVGETPRVKLSDGIFAVINTGAERGQKHINSPLVDSGSNWPIRTETINNLEYLDFFLYRK